MRDGGELFEESRTSRASTAAKTSSLRRRSSSHEIELIELARRAVGAPILIPVAGCDLEVAIEKPGHHDDLFEHLGRLRKRVEFAPGCSRDGTRKSRAPSGLEAVSVGVWYSHEAEIHHAATDTGNDL